MDNSVTINAHKYNLTRQDPTGQIRSALVEGVPYSLTTAYQETKQGGVPVIRTQRKVTVQAPVTVNGTLVPRAIEVGFVLSRPLDVLVSNPDLGKAVAELKAWVNTDTFLDEILNNEI
ncbi:coat protein [ssRNA phage SRR5467090_10]|uniref:Coat protein n=1 Tax=ssRNA phage SRR5467090_10 TaxID=2786448 RepID=A0A8S5L5G3_9VIRU|nr:coat protein [ssRNA phage SRR5467090_10]DAD52490.1 TPA_asm: coat protein [ssRNA phage SRR5467090_10]